MTDFETVELPLLDGTTLRGNFFQAEGDGVAMAVLTVGLGLLKEHYSDSVARGLRDAGISALLYDHRGWGESGGSPRQQTDILQQAEDLHDVISTAASLPGVDPNRVVIHGGGHGGGVAMVEAADDPRLKAVIINSPFTSGRFDAPTFPPDQLSNALIERSSNLNDLADATYLQLWPTDAAQAANRDPDVAVMPGEGAVQFYQVLCAKNEELGLKWDNKLTLQSLYYLSRAVPRDFVPRISCPILYLAGADELFAGPVSMHEDIVASANDATFHVIEPPYFLDSSQTSYKQVMDLQVEFIRRHA